MINQPATSVTAATTPHPSPWHQRYAAPAVAAAWILTAATSPWLPARALTLAVGACLAGTVLHVWRRNQATVQAAFLQGMLYERDTGHARHIPDLPRAVGDGNVTAFHGRTRPSPVRRST